MLLDFNHLLTKYKAKPKGVIQVGAHTGGEYNAFVANGIHKMVLIEPCRAAFEELKKCYQYNPNVLLLNIACGDKFESGAMMNTGDNTVNSGQSNSLLKPKKHLTIHPEVEFTDQEEVTVELLDSMPELRRYPYDLLVMDCQGYEGHVLRGGKRLLSQIDWVYTEVNKDEVYEGNALVEEIDALLSDFERVETGKWVGDAWTDAFYVRKTLL